MAYSYIVNLAQGGKPGKPGPPIQANVGGALVLIYEVHEYDVSPGDEFVIECVPVTGIVSLYGAEVTDDAGGTVTTLQPSLGTAPGYVEDTLDHVWTRCTLTMATVREANVASYASPSERLVGRAGVTAPGGSVVHRLTITEGHGHPVGLGAGYSRDNPAPVEQLDKAIYTGGFFVTDAGSAQLAIDARFTGAVIDVHNGLDNVYWLGANITGNSVTFDDGTRAFDGVQSILISAMGVGTTFDITAPAPVDVSGYLALEIRVWVAANYTAGDMIEVYCVVNGVEVGARINLGLTIERTQIGGWQSAILPTADFSLPAGTIDGIRVEQGAKSGASPTMSFDAIKWHESGGPAVFVVAAPPGFRLRVRRIVISLLAEHTPATTNNGTKGLSPLGFLGGATLPNGVAAASVVGGVPIIAGIFKDHRDFSVFAFREPIVSSDGVLTSVSYMRDHDPAFLVEGDPALFHLQFILSDDLSYLADGRAFWVGSIEAI